MKNNFNSKLVSCIIAALVVMGAVSIAFLLSGCTEATRVNQQLSHDAARFNCQRRITVYNAISDNIILEIEGLMDVSNNVTDELVVTCKTGKNEYKKNYVYLNQFTLYVVEDITGTEADPYHYKVEFHRNIIPDVEIKP